MLFLYPSLLANGTKETIVLDIDANGEKIISERFELTDEQLHFTNKKPSVIYGYAAVPKKQNTTNRFWYNGFRINVALKIDNFPTRKSNTLNEANFMNCIIDGNSNHKLQFTVNS